MDFSPSPPPVNIFSYLAQHYQETIFIYSPKANCFTKVGKVKEIQKEIIKEIQHG